MTNPTNPYTPSILLLRRLGLTFGQIHAILSPHFPLTRCSIAGVIVRWNKRLPI